MECKHNLEWFYDAVGAALENSGVNAGEDIWQKLSDDEARNLLDGIFSIHGELQAE